MKHIKVPLLLLAAVLTLSHLSSCGEDRWEGYAEQTQTDRWIDDTMRVWYYWKDEMPPTEKLNYFQKPADFFRSLLSKEDKYSTIDSLKAVTRSIAGTDNSYGFEFSIDQRLNDTAYYARVLYVAHHSPADEGGLQRGDLIARINGRYITTRNYSQLLFNGPAATLDVGRYNADTETVDITPEAVRMDASRTIEDNPVYYHNVYTRGDRRIGYLVYNHFNYGPTDNATNRPYDEALLQVSNELAAQHVNELILDLRYNNGGYISCAELLCTLLAPASALGQPLGYAIFNSLQSERSYYTLNPALIAGGTNLDLKRLFVLTSSETASASEMVINCLKPYMEVIVVGQQTVGKNVGSTAFRNPELRIVLNPIVCRFYNVDDQSDYGAGFIPDVPLRETSDPARFLPFGNENEMLLGSTLALIAGTTLAPSDLSAPSDTRTTSPAAPDINSLARRATPAVQMD
jgi:C-terminal processing protease CtpA/Prc